MLCYCLCMNTDQAVLLLWKRARIAVCVSSKSRLDIGSDSTASVIIVGVVFVSTLINTGTKSLP